MNTANYREVVIIIPTYTNTDGLNKLIRCLEQHISRFPVVIVNNGEPGLKSRLEPHYRLSVSIIQQPRNMGFARACNDGARMAIHRYRPRLLVLLNDDVTFDHDWLTPCMNTMEANDWSATVPVLVRPNGSIENCGYRILKRGKIHLITKPTYTGRVDGITAAAMVIERTTYESLDGFDESFFAYLEDVDMCIRMKSMGENFGVTRETSVVHEGQATSSKMSRRKAKLDYANWIKIINRHWSTSQKIQYAPSIIMERLRNLSGVMKAK